MTKKIMGIVSLMALTTVSSMTFAQMGSASSAIYEEEMKQEQQATQQVEVTTQSFDELTEMSVATAKEKQQLQNSTVYVVAKTLGLNWKQDRNALATKFGITNYTGTREQNMKIKERLLSMINIAEAVATTTNNNASVRNVALPMITKTASQKSAIKNQPLFVIVKSFGFDWKTDRASIANAVGITNYLGSVSQNMEIKQALLNNISVQ